MEEEYGGRTDRLMEVLYKCSALNKTVSSLLEKKTLVKLRNHKLVKYNANQKRYKN